MTQCGGRSAVSKGGAFSIGMMYKLLRGCFQKVQWKRTICNDKASPSSLFITSLALLDRLATVDRLIKWQNVCDPICVLCKSVPESAQDLFFTCSYSAYVWQEVLDLLHINRSPGTWQQKLKQLGELLGRQQTSSNW